jgi:hypothetical protein
MLAAAWLTAGATTGLLVGAIFTAIYAMRAFRAQSREVAAIEQQVKDQQQVTGQQGQLLELQSGQLGLQRQQLDEQRRINEAQTEILKLQAQELSESLAERKRQEEDHRRAQASKVAAWFTCKDEAFGEHTLRSWGALIRNDSDLPILAVRVFFHFIQEEPGGDWQPINRGGPVERVRLVPPHHDEFIEIPKQISRMIDEIGENVYAVSIEFTDAAGNKWERDPRGALLPRS